MSGPLQIECAGTPRLTEAPIQGESVEWVCWSEIGVGIINSKAIGKIELFGGKAYRIPRKQGKSISGYKGGSGRRKRTL